MYKVEEVKGPKLIGAKKFYQVSRHTKGGLVREIKGRLLVLRHRHEMKALKR